MANVIIVEQENNKEIGSAISISDSKILDFEQIDRIGQGSDFASYFALNRLTEKIEDRESCRLPPFAQTLRHKYQKYKWLRQTLCILLILINVLQRPVWCNFDDYEDFCQKRNGFTYNIPTMVDYYLPILVYYGLDMIIVILLAIFKLIKAYTQTHDQERKYFAFSLVALAIVVSINDIIVLYLENKYKYNISSLMKSIFIVCYSRQLQITLKHYVQIINRGKEIYYLMVFSLVFFCGLGVALFKELDFNETKVQHCAVNESPFHQSIQCTFLILFQLQTTVNSPDIYLKYYNYERAYVAYFIIFQFINTLLIINLIVAFFYSAYKNVIEEQTRSLLQSHHDKISRYTAKYLRKRSQSEIRVQIRDIDELSPGWLQVYDILDNQIFEQIMEFVNFTIFLLIFFDNKERIIQIINLSLNSLIMLEIIVITCFTGIKKQFKSKDQILNLFVTISIIILLCSVIVNEQNWRITLLQVLMCYRLFRGCKWLLKSKNFTFLLVQILAIFSYVIQLFGMLFVLFLFFSALGQLLFGGSIHTQLPQLEFNELYSLINFNDFLSGMCTCWFLLIINNWNIISFGFAQVMESDVVYIFFISYYIIVVLLTLNVTMALLIDYLVNRWHNQNIRRENLVEPLQQLN